MINILIHAINGIGLWHIQRTLAVAEALRSDASIGRIVFLTNSQHPEFIEQRWFTVERIDIGIEDTLRGTDFSEYERQTRERLENIVHRYDISAVVHDTFFIRPFVTNSPDLEHFLILRDCDLGYMNDISQIIPHFRSVLLPHVADELSEEKRQFIERFSNIHFTGYVLSREIPVESGFSEGCKVLVSPGLGGDLEGVMSFFSYVLSLRSSLSNILEEDWTFVLGKHAKILREQLNFPWWSRLIDLSMDMRRLMAGADVLVGRGGYNTLVEVFGMKKRALLFPASRELEDQSGRIRYFEKHTNFICAGVGDIDRDSQMITSLGSLQNSSSDIGIEDFQWAQKAAEIITCELAKKRVLVYKHIFLPKSEQFLRCEFESFQKIEPHFLSLAAGDMSDIPDKLSRKVRIARIFSELLNPQYPIVSDPAAYANFLTFIRGYLTRKDIDTIYAPFLSDAFFLWPLKRIVPWLRMYSAARWHDAYVFLSGLDQWIMRAFLSDLDGIFSRDSHMQNHIICQMGKLNRDRVTVVRSAVSAENYHFRTAPFLPMRILIGGRLVEKKGIVPLMDLLAGLYDSGYPIERITLVWDGPLRMAVLERIGELGLSESVSYVGVLNHAQFLETMSQHSCYMSYSRPSTDGDDEGIPNMLVENMMTGNLIFSTLSGGVSEIIRDGETGFVLSGDTRSDTEKILATLRILESYPSEYTLLLERANDIARTVFSKEHSTDILESFLSHE